MVGPGLPPRVDVLGLNPGHNKKESVVSPVTRTLPKSICAQDSQIRANPKPPSQTDSLVLCRKRHPWFLTLRFADTA
ncbi:hypothetical protein L1987_31369 [Smallanthus sonchifolius]|uniref:Uncharacterized protein n=1 Tax=Smallanthus sonchifolius TaxID=185202 RepID=A0ACB9I5F4_9ASTR|nr:hypothetical protein L1987_31369 [Smallanthus sonchifolius]